MSKKQIKKIIFMGVGCALLLIVGTIYARCGWSPPSRGRSPCFWWGRCPASSPPTPTAAAAT